MTYEAGSVTAKVILDTSQFNEAIKTLKEEASSLKTAFNNVKGENPLAKQVAQLKKDVASLKQTNEDYRKTLKKLRDDMNKGVKTGNSVKEIQKLKTALKELADTPIKKNSVKEYLRFWSEAEITVKRTSNEIKSALNNTFEINTLNKVQSRFNQFLIGFNQLTGAIVKTTEVLRGFNFRLLEGINKETIFYKRTVQLASAMWKLNSGQGKYYQGNTQFNYSQYIAQANRVTQALEKQRLKTVNLASAQYRLANAYRGTGVNLNTYKANINSINAKLTQQTQRTQKLASAQYRLFQKYHTTNLNTYKANLTEITNRLKQQETQLNKTSAAARNSGRGLTSFNNGVVQTAHSGRILSNTLYQIRGALLSLKMIFTAMGGMALWGFATEIAEGVKNTLTAKNEMEAQLKQNKNVGKGGLEYFNQGLEDLAKNYKKVNKYMVGETATAVGLEFDLTAKQMKEALPIITMVQSEYVRAGRKEEEAALAIKDILQGEFQRLSRETGVGKEELLKYGWSGKKEDIESLLKALKKAALDRHWDLFAKKATSLNDVLTITRSRFSETGADILNSATPLIVSGFNILIDSISNVQNAFNGLNPFLQNFTLYGGGVSLFGGILTALPMVTKGMGLADIATIGWKKSILTAALNLNKLEVAQYGFRKALAATITGTTASEISTMKSSKAILGRIIGLDAMTLKEKGWLGAMVKNQVSMREGITLLGNSSAYTMTRAQKLAYLTTNMDLNTAAGLKNSEAIKKVATSWKVLRTIIFGVISIGVIAWFAAVSAQADLVKKRINAFNEVVETGDEKVKDAKKTVNDYTSALSKLKKGTDEYKRASANLDIAKANQRDIEYANKIAKAYEKQNKEREKSIKMSTQGMWKNNYLTAGNDYSKATEKASGWTEKVKQAQYEITNSYNKQYEWLEASSKHINQNVKQLKEGGATQEQMNRYISEYSAVAEEAGEHLKKFYQGDMDSLSYYAWDRLRLLWIDIWNNKHFVNFWSSVKKAYNDLKPTLNQICKTLGDIANAFLDVSAAFLYSKPGQMIALIGGVGTAVGIVALKIGKWVTGSKSTFDVLKKLGSSLKDRIKDWRNLGDEAEKANKKQSPSPTTTTGGVTGNTPKTRGEWWQNTKGQIYNDATKYARAAVAIAAGMVLITEALIMLQAPMWGLAQVGNYYKSVESSIKSGIEGLKTIAPIMAILLPSVVGLSLIFDHYEPSFTRILTGTGKAFVGIAAGMILVAESIALIIPSIWALAAVGGQYQGLQSQVQSGVQGIKVVSDSLKYLLPFIPALAGGILLGIAIFETGGFGAILTVAVAGGIAIGLGLVAETILLLQAPLWSIGEVGRNFKDLSDVKRGAEAIKATAEALSYVELAMRALMVVQFEEIGLMIGSLVTKSIGFDLTQLTGEGGLFDQLNKFTEDFNTKVNITPIDTSKVTALTSSATGINSVKNALTTVKEALTNLPNFTVDTQTPNEKYQSAVSGTAQNSSQGFFDKLQEPIKQLNDFITKFNAMEIVAVDSGKVSAVSASANAIGTIKSAIDQVKAATGSAVDAQWNSNVASSGLIGAGIGLLLGNGNMGSSSISGALNELYNCVKDIMNFNTRISGLTGGSANTGAVSGAVGMVSALQTQINGVKTALSGAVPAIKSAATGTGKAVISGFKSGISGWTTTVTATLSYANTSFSNAGKTYGTNLSNGFKNSAKIKDTATGEVSATLTALDGKYQEFYNKGYKLGDAFQRGYKDGGGIHSPGYAAQAMQGEIGYMGQYIQEGLTSLPSQAYQLASNVASQFKNPFNGTSLQLPNLTQFKQGIAQVPSMVNNMKTQVSTSFTGIQTKVASSFNSIVGKTRTSLASMQTNTTKNIGAIRTSWHGMQSALITSAENIRSKTGQKINNLKDNMAKFWKKIQNPSLLLSAGGHTGTRKRRFTGNGGSKLKGLYAGGTSSKRSGGNLKLPNISSDILQYIQCLIETGKPCYAGGWNFNWSKSIQDKFNGWNTHFGKYSIDDYVKVGKFHNNSFPVKGIAAIAKAYIFDTIRSTQYDKYFNSNFGDDPVAALAAGAFNCWDGTNIVLGLARAFGFSGSREHGTWNGIGHVWANIPGLGIIDPTAIQNNGSFKSSSVRGYSAGGTTSRSKSKGDTPFGDNHTYNTNIEIHVHGNDVEVDNRRIDKQSGRQILDILGINPSTGR